MSRSLMRHTIAELEQLFDALKADPKTLKALEEELQHRQTPRAAALLAKVQGTLKILKGAKSGFSRGIIPTPTIAPAAKNLNQQPDLWCGQSSPVPGLAPAPALAKQDTHPLASSPAASHGASVSALVSGDVTEVELGMSAADAYKVLKATSCSTWETIEQTRREVVQQAYPERVATLTPELRATARTEAKKANAAYAILGQLRTRNIE